MSFRKETGTRYIKVCTAAQMYELTNWLEVNDEDCSIGFKINRDTWITEITQEECQYHITLIFWDHTEKARKLHVLFKMAFHGN